MADYLYVSVYGSEDAIRAAYSQDEFELDYMADDSERGPQAMGLIRADLVPELARAQMQDDGFAEWTARDGLRMDAVWEVGNELW